MRVCAGTHHSDTRIQPSSRQASHLTAYHGHCATVRESVPAAPHSSQTFALSLSNRSISCSNSSARRAWSSMARRPVSDSRMASTGRA